jgi:tripartite-type tricarboxylate transporter receptor subunit TctC
VLRPLLLCVLVLTFPLSAFAQGWPTQPVRIMVGFPPGGTTDVIGRLVANELSEQERWGAIIRDLGIQLQ